MNGIDIVILVILCGFLLKGLLRGLLKEVCSLAGLFVGAFLA
ncbi:MAG: CvpA family protein, partial [Desulfuromonadales bacterium]